MKVERKTNAAPQPSRSLCTVNGQRTMSTRHKPDLRVVRAPSTKAMERVGGDSRGGFEVAVDKVDCVIHLKLWGVWHMPVANEFCTCLIDFAGAFLGRKWAIVADSERFGAQSQEVSRLRQETMEKLRGLGCDKIASIGSSVIHAMQFKRISNESHLGGAVFENEKAALEWIHEDRRQSK